MRKAIQRVIARLEQGWCQGSYAVDKNGQTVDLDAPEACCWCLAGAIKLEVPEIIERINLDQLIRDKTGFAKISFNDAVGRTKEQVIAVLKDIANGLEAR